MLKNFYAESAPDAYARNCHTDSTPLTSLTDDEILFRDNVRQFAEEKVCPLARGMDEKGVFDKELIAQFFQLGLMGMKFRKNMAERAENSLRRFSRSKNFHAPMLRPE